MRVFAGLFGVTFGLAAAGNLPRAAAPSTAAVVFLVLLALLASYRAGQGRPRSYTYGHPAQTGTVNVAAPPVALEDRAAERSDARSSKAADPEPAALPVDRLEAVALLSMEYGVRVDPDFAVEVIREMYADQSSGMLDNGAATAMLSGQPDEPGQ